MKQKNYRSRFYTGKILGVIFSTIIYEVLALLAWFLALSTFVMPGLGYFLLFGGMGAFILLALLRINKVRYMRTKDEWHKEAASKGKKADSFWSKRSTDTIFIMALLEVCLLLLFFMLIVVFINITMDLVWGACVGFFATMIGVLIIQFGYNGKLKKLSVQPMEFSEEDWNSVILWNTLGEDEVRNVVCEACVQIAGEILLFMIFPYIGSLRILLFLLVPIIVVAVVRIVSLRKMRENMRQERLQTQKEKEREDIEETEEFEDFQEEKVREDAEENENSGLTMQQYADYASFSALCEDFVRFASANELSVSVETAKEIFAAMATSRAVWLCHKNDRYTKQLAIMLQRFFTDFEDTVRIDTSLAPSVSLLQSERLNEGENPSRLKEQLRTAKARTNSVNVIVFEVAEYENFNAIFAPLINCFRAPEGENLIQTQNDRQAVENGNQEQLVLPFNIWCIFTVKSKELLPQDVVEYGSVAQIAYGGGECSLRIPEKREKVLPYSRFNELVAEIMQENFLPLDVWKKFDRIEEYLQSSVPFEINNPLARQIETYSSVLLACGVSLIDVVDKVLVSRIFPLLNAYTKEQLNQEGNTFSELLDGLFGMDNIPLSHKMLSDKNWA